MFGLLLLASFTLAADPLSAQQPYGPNGKPFFLVASPDMPDPTFQQTVILMLPPVALPLVAGIVINKPTKVTLGQLFDRTPDIRNKSEPVYFGGPVEMESPAVLMRGASPPGAAEKLLDGVYIVTEVGPIGQILKSSRSEKDVRVFLGRAQWTMDKLRSEILRGAWTVSAASPRLVFSSDAVGLWRLLVQQSKLRQVINDPGNALAVGQIGFDGPGEGQNPRNVPNASQFEPAAGL